MSLMKQEMYPQGEHLLLFASSDFTGDRINEPADENRILCGIAADFDRAKKALGKEKMEAAVESVKLEEARVQAEKHRKCQYTR